MLYLVDNLPSGYPSHEYIFDGPRGRGSIHATSEDLMAALTDDEKALIEEALGLYLQAVARQMGQAQAQQLAAKAQEVLMKLDSLSGSGGGHGGRPHGISEEWYTHVCRKCSKLTPAGCSDKVTEKFPGKCDPILHYEREKALKGKR